MRKLTIILCALLAAACHSEDKVALTPATLDVTIDKVGATKVNFTVTCSDPDATYIYVGVGKWEDYWYDNTDQEIAREYLEQLISMETDEYLKPTRLATFQDRFCFKGNRSFNRQFLAQDMDYRMIVFQVDPFRKEIIGQAVSTPFHTESLPPVSLDFEARVEGDVLTIIPSNDTDAYYWDYESIEYYWGNLSSSVYFYMYEITDMYEQYGFIDHVLSHGRVSYVFSEEDEGMVEGETIVLSAVPYANHELADTPTIWMFVYHKDGDNTILQPMYGPERQFQAPLRPSQWQEHRSRRNR